MQQKSCRASGGCAPHSICRQESGFASAQCMKMRSLCTPPKSFFIRAMTIVTKFSTAVTTDQRKKIFAKAQTGHKTKASR